RAHRKHHINFRLASLHQQQRNEIMKNLFLLVNTVFSLSLRNLSTSEAARFAQRPSSCNEGAEY
ncbi:hypothetical protein, partial [Caballeronia pedi]|uniref:hypothetical protein n=1 Tax=Caballeronia pedi TaxID=1777141 RepID=UPI001ABF226C